MKQNSWKGAAVLLLLCGCLPAHAQRGQGATKMAQLITDIQNVMPNATLSDDQKTKLQADIDSVKKQLQDMQENGTRPDRDKFMAAVTDMRTIVDSGAFKSEDQQALDKEFDSVNRR
jgi:septal ring factor EnvC (AmiA/AmiB activator)